MKSAEDREIEYDIAEEKKQRLIKQEFSLSEGDDSWGFQESPLKLRTTLSTLEKVLYTIVIAYFAYYIINALTFIF